MIALEVYLNGRKICTAGDERFHMVSGGVSLIRSSAEAAPDIHLSVNGMAEADFNRELLTWASRMLSAGDSVEVRVVNCEHADKPEVPVVPRLERLA